jgi:hypothetical protein
VTTITPTSIDNKKTKVKRLREDRFCVFILQFFCQGFVLWWVFFLCTFFKLRKKIISKNLVIIFKLNTIESLYSKEKDFATILVFLGSCHNLIVITKECVCVVWTMCECVNT